MFREQCIRFLRTIRGGKTQSDMEWGHQNKTDVYNGYRSFCSKRWIAQIVVSFDGITQRASKSIQEHTTSSLSSPPLTHTSRQNLSLVVCHSIQFSSNCYFFTSNCVQFSTFLNDIGKSNHACTAFSFQILCAVHLIPSILCDICHRCRFLFCITSLRYAANATLL